MGVDERPTKMFLVSATITTSVASKSAHAAVEDVAETIGAKTGYSLDLGPEGEKLPFTVDGVAAREITEEEIGRGYDGPPVTTDAEYAWGWPEGERA